MFKRRPLLVETLTAVGLIAAPLVLPHIGFAPNTINRILVWGLFGIGFDILFGYTGLLSFGQSAFYGTGGFVAAYLLTQVGFPSVWLALIIGMVAAGVVGYLVGLIALRRTGIYFAMITVAIAEVFYFVEFSPLSAYTGGENGLPGVPTPTLYLGFATIRIDSSLSMYVFLAACYFVGLVIALRIVRSPVGAVLSAIRDNPLRAAAVGHNIHAYKLAAFVVAAAYAGFAGGLLGVLQAFMPPDAFTFDTSGQLVMQTAIGGAGTLFGPLIGAALWLFLQDFLQSAFNLGAAWKLVLGLVFVLLVCFLRRGIVGGLVDLVALVRGLAAPKAGVAAVAPAVAAEPVKLTAASAKILLLDEPFEGLAPIIVRDLLATCRTLAEAGQTILVVEQNISAAMTLADRIYILNNGHMVEELTAQSVRGQPEVLHRPLGV
jgi:branched-chain amino acid transport system permease protein